MLSAVLGMAPHTAAYCGLEHCPIGYRPEQPAKWAVGLSWRMVTFKQAGREVGFQQGTTRLEWRPSRRFILGGDLPVSAPLTASKHAYGFSNPLVFAEAALLMGEGARLSIGSQLELPYGDISEGFASNHVMGVPYAVVGRSIGAFSLSTRLGWSTAIPYRASKAAAQSRYDNPFGTSAQSARVAHLEPVSAGTATFIEPHSDRDLLFRIEGSLKFRVATAALSLNGAHAMEPEFAPENAVSFGASVEVPFGEGFSIRPEVRFPLMRPARFESAGGMGIRKAF
jgi:hypothetical protein